MRKLLVFFMLVASAAAFGQATLSVIPNGTDSSPNSPLHMLLGATTRVYANQCTGAQSLGCTSTAPAISWSATCGTFSASTGPFVDYTAPSSGSSCVITATDSTDSLTATATVTIETPTVAVNVLPHALTLYKNQHQLLQAFVLGAANRNVTWSTSGGTLVSQGWTADFSASSAGTYTVTATSSADGSKSFAATMYVTANAMPASATPNHTEPVDCTATGSGTTYEVGPSQTYTTINSLPWPTMAAGSTVRIHNEGGTGSPTNYAERWLITTDGTVTQPIRICGVPNGNGELPVLNGANSTTLVIGTYNYHTMDGYAIINISKGYQSPGDAVNYVQYVTIEGLKFINANPTQQYQAQGTGTLTNFITAATSVRVQSGGNITFRGNDIENNGNGFFSNAQMPETQMTRWHLIQGNYFASNGVNNDTHEHQIYGQAFGQVIQGNYFGETVSGDQGSQIKTRCVACIIRYNYAQGVTNTSLGRLLDMVAPESSDGEAMVQEFIYNTGSFGGTTTMASVTAMEDWYQQYVYGNILVNAVAGDPIHYSEDNCSEDAPGRPGYFYHNTFYSTLPSGTAYRWNFIDGDYGSGGPTPCYPARPRTRWPSMYIANNAIALAGSEGYFFWSRNLDTPIYLGTNWINSSWGTGGVGNVDGNGTAYQATMGNISYMTGNSVQHVYVGAGPTTCSNATCGGSLITGTGTPFDTTSYIPTSGSPLIGAAGTLPASLGTVLPVTFQYSPTTYLMTPRINANDLGALPYASLPTGGFSTMTGFSRAGW
jgi:hypothetical protein